jgi:branched-subunit amino acid ABC-type transport system permease component
LSEIWSFIATTPWLDYTVSGVVLGSIYALLAVGLAMIKGIANLINFAHGAIFTVGAYVGWTRPQAQSSIFRPTPTTRRA